MKHFSRTGNSHRTPPNMDGGRITAFAIGAFIAFGAGLGTATATDGLPIDAGGVTFEENGPMNLGLAMTRAAVAPMWVSNPIAEPYKDGAIGTGTVTIETADDIIKINVGSGVSASDIANAINSQNAPVRATLFNTGATWRLAVAAQTASGPAAFEDTGTMHVPTGIESFEDTGTMHLDGAVRAVALGMSLSSLPFDDPDKKGAIGKGELWLQMGENTVIVDTKGMSLRDIAEAINGEDAPFKARLEKQSAGHVLVIDAVSHEVAALFDFEDTGTMRIPGASFSFEDTGTMRVGAGYFAFEDTGTMHTAGGAISFEDTGTMHVPGNHFSFEDTGTMRLGTGTMSFEDTGTMRIDLGNKPGV
jgi:hypothetical protein